MQALCRVTWQNPSVFQNVLEVMGLSVVCQALTQGITRVQQAVVTMFGALVSTTAHLTRLTQDKVVCLSVVVPWGFFKDPVVGGRILGVHLCVCVCVHFLTCRTWVSVLVCVCVCVCMCVCVYVCVLVFVCAWV